MIFAYWLEDSGKLGKRVEHIHKTMLQRRDVLCSSLFILSELLVGPLKEGDSSAAGKLEQFFHSDNVSMLPYTGSSVRVFAELRAHHGVKSLDALQLAIAADAGVELFLTHDRRLHKLVMPGLPFIATLETDIF
jgi:predicted nucleic acid-binding protein